MKRNVFLHFFCESILVQKQPVKWKTHNFFPLHHFFVNKIWFMTKYLTTGFIPCLDHFHIFIVSVLLEFRITFSEKWIRMKNFERIRKLASETEKSQQSNKAKVIKYYWFLFSLSLSHYLLRHKLDRSLSFCSSTRSHKT